MRRVIIAAPKTANTSAAIETMLPVICDQAPKWEMIGLRIKNTGKSKTWMTMTN